MLNIRQMANFMGTIPYMNHPRHLAFMKRIAKRFSDFITESPSACPEKLQGYLNNLVNKSIAEDECYKLSTASDLTPLLEEADKRRDDIIIGGRAMCESLTKIGTSEQKPAAQVIIDAMKFHKINTKDKYEDQGIKVDQFCQACVTQNKLSTAVETCNLTSLFTELASVNQQCIDYVTQRNTERSQLDLQAMNKARAATDDAYTDAMVMLNAYTLVSERDGHSDFDLLIDSINEDIRYYRTMVLNIGANESGTGSGENGTGGTEPSQGDEGGGTEPGTGGGDTGGDDNGGDTGGDTGGGTVTPDPGTGGGDTGGGGTGDQDEGMDG